jgi:hypothetical protein
VPPRKQYLIAAGPMRRDGKRGASRALEMASQREESLMVMPRRVRLQTVCAGIVLER